MGQTTLRPMPVREDHWKPQDRIYEGILERCVANAEDDEARDGTAEMMAGGLIIVVLFLIIMAGANNATAALIVCGILAGAGFLYIVSASKPGKGNRALALAGIGGPGRLPAGYLVHPTAWQAGMAQHVAGVPESQLLAASQMCHIFPGTVDDLISFVGHVAIHVPVTQAQTAEDVQRRAKELVRIGMPIVVDYAKSAPPLPVPGEPGGKKGKSKKK
ncbi:hypothetical protein [Paractinoplanes atraurantiacus]|uniref:Uncharacterized protein n=1 Tax=Paractinoplanes atraurantiacus TaxID=1036182 RepID=A0A285ICH4_9ACTN|nr:hypothetical protein [Actinoplanes atraurantiacus]SNY45675.1 hypothetical protein SAMN05421748_107271 [Actinoplanes atraurantiacus]